MILKLASQIPNPPQGIIAIFRNANAKGIVYYMAHDGYNYPVEHDQGIYRIPNPDFTNFLNYTGQKILELKLDATEFLFTLVAEQIIQRLAGGGGGGVGIRGLLVQDEGTQINGFINTENFIGELVTVTDAGGGKVNITIVIPSMTTAQRIALVPTTALVVQDISLDMYFKWSTVTSSWSPF